MEIAKEGSNEIWFKGHGPDPYVYFARKGPKKFLGGTFEVASEENFKRLVKVDTGYTCGGGTVTANSLFEEPQSCLEPVV